MTVNLCCLRDECRVAIKSGVGGHAAADRVSLTDITGRWWPESSLDADPRSGKSQSCHRIEKRRNFSAETGKSRLAETGNLLAILRHTACILALENWHRSQMVED